jgi:hypothetical protein
VTVNFGVAGQTQLCATPTNPCYDLTPICIDIDIQPRPYVERPPDITVCNGAHVVTIFEGTGWDYEWGQQVIPVCEYFGLNEFYGAGNPLDFIAVNNGTMPISCLLGVNAVQGECNGDTKSWHFTVLPTPQATQPPNVTVCGGAPVSVPLTGPVATGFAWTNDSPAIGLPASGTGNIAFTTVKKMQTEIATVTVTPLYTAGATACPGDPVTFTITVEGSNVNDPPDITVCPDQPVNIPFSGNATDYTWTNNNPAIGLDGSGSGTISFTTEGAAAQQTATVTVTPQPCPFGSESFTITVRPRAVADPLPDTTVCAGDSLNLIITGTPGTSFSWTNSNPAIGLPAGGTLPFLRFAAPAVDTAISGTITVTPTRQGCVGQPISFVITVKKCCATAAGTLDTTAIVVCGPDKIIALPLPANYHLEPGDSLRFVLYSNPANPLGSIVQYSDTLLFHFLPDSMHLDSTYFVAVLAGPLLAGDSLLLDAAAKCFSLYKGPKVRWAKKPAMSLASPPEDVCRDGCTDVLFELTGTPPFEFTWQVVQNGQVLLSRDETAAGHQHLVTVCPADFDLPAAGNTAVEVRVVWLVDRDCGCGD